MLIGVVVVLGLVVLATFVAAVRAEGGVLASLEAELEQLRARNQLLELELEELRPRDPYRAPPAGFTPSVGELGAEHDVSRLAPAARRDVAEHYAASLGAIFGGAIFEIARQRRRRAKVRARGDGSQ